ncbi:Transposase IS66 family protein [Aquisphaera giovannonii]|uniref:Transposase IS66 family protein n=1 Tax=Aquisphaera giovannonii TaxID=406548 RepID=A0A5B9W5G8_9BACT|nr:IS66 family transposase [Aquisphaera giovannonii]QEH35892.1 Transposase IS66 family protein [Aquisphaera giovannonii]
MSLEITDDLIARQSPEAQAIIGLLLARIAEQDRRIARLEAELESLRKTPQNSSLPPSTQHPHARPASREAKSRRKRGGQPGHRKHERPLIRTEDCQAVVTLMPGGCRRCGTRLSGVDPEPLRHQVWELPEIKPVVTEYQRHRLSCPRCGEGTCAELPAGVPRGQSGPRLIAFVATLMAHFRQSKRRTSLFVTSVLNIPCCPSLTVKHQRIATRALQPAYDRLVAALPSQPHLNGDESPTREGTTKAWLWTFVAGTFTVFALRGSRAATAISELLGEAFAGVMTCDRAKMYWRCGRLQWCWAHLKRDFQALVDHADPQVRRLGHDLMRPTRELFRQWSRCRDGTISRGELGRALAPVRHRVEALLLRGAFSGNPRLTGMCRELYDHRDWLWSFLDVDGVEPTNNAGERSLRHAVIWRKLSFGTQSPHGSRFVETLLSVIETCRQQDRNVLDFVTHAVTAHFRGETSPSLLPGP